MSDTEYKTLTAHFFKATQKGQIASLWKRKDIPNRIEEYKRALSAGHCTLSQPLNRGQALRMEQMGIVVPENLKPVLKVKKVRVPRALRVPRNPDDVRLTHKQVNRLLSFGVTTPAEMMPINGPRKPKVQAPEVQTPSADNVPE